MYVQTPLASAVALFAILLLPVAGNTDSDGNLYQKFCSSCHGEEGLGSSAPALNKDGLLRTVDETYFINSIRNGRPMRGCPSFDKKISADEARLLARFIKGWQKEKTLKAPAHDVSPKKTERGEDLFQLCGGCHGLEGEGAMGPPLLDPGFLKSISDTELRRTIMWGRPGTPMKGYLKGKGGLATLTEKEIDEIISYIRYRQKTAQ